MNSKYRKAIFVVTYRKEKDKILYLILKRKLHWTGWEFPKGGMEKKEKLIPAVKRELREETGNIPIKINNHYISGRYKYPKRFDDRPGIIGQTYKLFSAELKNKKIKIDKKEHSGYKWLDFEKSIRKLTYPLQKRCISIVNKKLDN